MRWAIVKLVLVLMMVVGLPILGCSMDIVRAATAHTTADVTVMTRGSIAAAPSAPTGFTITQVDIDSVNITYSTAVNITVIRVATNNYPTSPTDGWLVYSGNLTEITDTGLNLPMLRYYYRAWTYDGVQYSGEYAEGIIGGDEMEALADTLERIAADLFNTMTQLMNFALFVPVIFFSIMAFWKSSPVFCLLTAAVAVFTGFYWYDQQVTTYGLAIGLVFLAYGIFSFGMAFWYIFQRGRE